LFIEAGIREEGESRYYTGASQPPMDNADNQVDKQAEKQADKPSKTRRKKDMHALQALGTSLIDLAPTQIAEIDLPESLRAAVLEAQRIKSHEGRRRQLQYIGRLMRDVDPAPIRAKIDAWRGQSREATATMHAIERWRDRLLADEDALTAFIDAHPDGDVPHLRALIRNARAELIASKPPRAYRELFREIRRLVATPNALDAG
jgi:ribosome-associated protein